MSRKRSEEIVLAIDVGTSGTKVLLVGSTGKILAIAEKKYSIQYPKDGWTEQKPSVWWDATRAAIGQIRRKMPSHFARVRAIGLSGQMHGSVFLDKNRRVLRPAILWNDQRTASECRQIVDSVGGEEALRKWVNNGALTGYTAPKLLWLRNHEPRRYEKLHTLLLPKDYITLQLTGELGTDVSDASGTLLLDIQNRKWSEPILSRLEIDRSLLPPLRESNAIVGEVSERLRKELGLKERVVVVAGAGDQPAAALGMGIVRGGQVSVTIGTSGVVFAALDRFLDNRSDAIQVFCSAIEGRYCAFGCMLAAGDAFSWLESLRLVPNANIEKLIRLAESVPPGSRGVVFLPYLSGERCPHPDPTARGAWLGLRRNHSKGEMVRSVFEGVLFGLNGCIELMREQGIPVEELTSGGGGARSEFLLQLQAQIFDRPVGRMDSPHASAVGAAILALVGLGVFSSAQEATHRMLKTQKTYRPLGESKLFGTYGKYRDLYPRLRTWFSSQGSAPTVSD